MGLKLTKLEVIKGALTLPAFPRVVNAGR